MFTLVLFLVLTVIFAIAIHRDLENAVARQQLRMVIAYAKYDAELVRSMHKFKTAMADTMVSVKQAEYSFKKLGQRIKQEPGPDFKLKGE